MYSSEIYVHSLIFKCIYIESVILNQYFFDISPMEIHIIFTERKSMAEIWKFMATKIL